MSEYYTVFLQVYERYRDLADMDKLNILKDGIGKKL